METSNNRVLRYLRQLNTGLRGSIPLKDAFNELPLRSELYSADQMEQRGKHLGAIHKMSQHCPQNHSMTPLAATKAAPLDACIRLPTALKTNQQITPASEWLLDNFYLSEEQIRTARHHMPKGYSRELPCLLNGPSIGLPRVYDIVLEIDRKSVV